MLNPIHLEKVIRNRQVSGVFPVEIHEGVAWWIGACFVVVSKTSRMVVAYDGREATEEFRRRFLKGAMNAQHWACRIDDLGVADESQLKRTMKEQGGIPGALLCTEQASNELTVTIRLYDASGELLDEDTSLACIRDMIACDQVPIPVNEAARGRVEDRSDLVAKTEARS